MTSRQERERERAKSQETLCIELHLTFIQQEITNTKLNPILEKNNDARVPTYHCYTLSLIIHRCCQLFFFIQAFGIIASPFVSSSYIHTWNEIECRVVP